MVEIIPNWHPLFVRFPIALVIITTISFVVGIILRKSPISDELYIVSKRTLWFAGFFALLTAYTGRFAYNSVAHDSTSHQEMILHLIWALPTASLIFVSAIVSIVFRSNWEKKNILGTGLCLIILSLIGV